MVAFGNFAPKLPEVMGTHEWTLSFYECMMSGGDSLGGYKHSSCKCLLCETNIRMDKK